MAKGGIRESPSRLEIFENLYSEKNFWQKIFGPLTEFNNEYNIKPSWIIN